MSVVVAYMPSPQGRAALAAAVKEALARKTDLVVAAHVYLSDDGAFVSSDEAHVKEEITSLDLPGAQDVPLRVVSSVEEDAGEFIVRVAQSSDAERIVIGLRRKSRIGKLSLGAAAQRVIVEGTCPVLAVKDGAPE
ncbi:universal stress protein [Dermabacteraceae bacterium TAE3-ERU27]|nr:universal stress protein [Dermabacteraceae bacterium TAE3-ERU27]